MQQKSDPYSMLRPYGSTPIEECCSCEQLHEVYLAHKLGENPVHCLRCRGEVAPERVGLDVDTAEMIARWNSLYGAVYALWLNSGEYESWAENELLQKSSFANRQGLLVRKKLAELIPTKYLWFWMEDRPTSCPACGEPFANMQSVPFVCSSCEVCV